MTKIINLENDISQIKEKVKKLDEWDRLMQGQYQMIKILQDVRQEQIFGSERVIRLEEDMVRVKMRLGMAGA